MARSKKSVVESLPKKPQVNPPRVKSRKGATDPKKNFTKDLTKAIARSLIEYAVGWSPPQDADIRFHEGEVPQVYVWVLNPLLNEFRLYGTPDRWPAGIRDKWLEIVPYGAISVAPWGRAPTDEQMNLAYKCRELAAAQLNRQENNNSENEDESDGNDSSKEDYIHPFFICFDERAGQPMQWGFEYEEDKKKFLNAGSPEWWDLPKIRDFIEKVEAGRIWISRYETEDYEPHFDVSFFVGQLDQNIDQSVGYFQGSNQEIKSVESVKNIEEDEEFESMVEETSKKVLKMAMAREDLDRAEKAEFIKQTVGRYHAMWDQVQADSLYELSDMPTEQFDDVEEEEDTALKDLDEDKEDEEATKPQKSEEDEDEDEDMEDF